MALESISIYGGALGTFVTAIATVLLFLVTKSLAKQTEMLVNVSSQPHVVATIENNQWSLRHAEIVIENTGTATAYYVKTAFDPALPIDEYKDGIPFDEISVLKPGQKFSSYLSEFTPLIDKTFSAKVSWQRSPDKEDRDENVYTLNFSGLTHMSQLGARNPLIQMAQDLNHIREDFRAFGNALKRS